MEHITREQWLLHAVAVCADRFAARDKPIELPKVNVSCSWPGGGSPAKRIGECWARAASAAGVNEIFISPKLEDPVKVVQILVHELAHAVDDCRSNHKAGFTAIARSMGCVGKPTQMQPSEAWAQEVAAEVIARFGAFPHRKLDKSLSGQKKQTARMIKCECGSCGAVWRMAKKHIDAAEHGMWCPVCGEVQHHGEEGDE